jgi:hypothetical protein
MAAKQSPLHEDPLGPKGEGQGEGGIWILCHRSPLIRPLATFSQREKELMVDQC